MDLVRIEQRDRLALLVIDHPPVNAGSHGQRAALEAALRRTATMDIDGVVIASAGRHFYAGSDLREFDGDLQAPQLPDVIALIEGLHVPVAAAVTGLALGGGLELALACDLRIADMTAAFGFPEVTFGILPGAGGTVRAARLLGVPAAISLVTSARRVPATEAAELGLVDEVVAADVLLEAAMASLRRLGGVRRLVRELPVPTVDPEAVEKALQAIPRRARPNVRQAADIVVEGARSEVGAALAHERALFDRLRVEPESQDLRYLFFARQAAAKAMKSSASPGRVTEVGIIGAGTMGAALARTFVDQGFRVVVVDTNADSLERVVASRPTVETSTSLGAVAESDLIVEAVFEDMDVKKSLLGELEGLVRAETVLASNTSYLDLDQMASGLARPERFAGLHFFNPPDKNRLVEVVRTSATDDTTAATLGSIVARLGKSGIPAEVGEGFIGNRVYADYRGQAEFLIEEGATPWAVDEAMVDLGMAIGPFAVADMSGLDIAWARRRRLAPTRDPQQRYVEIPDQLCEAGRLGRKSGAGWYRYPEGARRGEPDPEVERLVEECRSRKGLEPRDIEPDEIQRRTLGAMCAAAAAVLTSGVAERASDIDVALTEGFAFPMWRGGPLRMMSRWPQVEVVDALALVHRSDPVAYAELAPVTRGVLPEQIAAVLEAVRP